MQSLHTLSNIAASRRLIAESVWNQTGFAAMPTPSCSCNSSNADCHATEIAAIGRLNCTHEFALCHTLLNMGVANLMDCASLSACDAVFVEIVVCMLSTKTQKDPAQTDSQKKKNWRYFFQKRKYEAVF